MPHKKGRQFLIGIGVIAALALVSTSKRFGSSSDESAIVLLCSDFCGPGYTSFENADVNMDPVDNLVFEEYFDSFGWDESYALDTPIFADMIVKTSAAEDLGYSMGLSLVLVSSDQGEPCMFCHAGYAATTVLYTVEMTVYGDQPLTTQTWPAASPRSVLEECSADVEPNDVAGVYQTASADNAEAPFQARY